MVKFTSVTNSLVKAKTATQWSNKETYAGRLKSVKQVTTPNGEAKIYVFEDSDMDGQVLETISEFFGSSNLDSGLSSIKTDQLVLITCNGPKQNPKSGRTYQEFDIKVAL